MSWKWVRTDDELTAAVAEASAYSAVAVDTEFRRRDTFYPQVALVQLAAGDNCWLIDPLTLTDTRPLSELLANTKVIKVLHSASEDLEVFEHWLGQIPQPIFDTQRAAALLNLGFGLSYRALVEALLGVELAKDETQSDWLKRPLSEAQCEYAAQDVTYLIRCWPILAERARERDRMAWILEEGAQMETGGKGPLAKFKSAWKLDPEKLAVLLALLEWRELQAKNRDKPRSWILNDKSLYAIAQRLPASTGALGAVDGIPPGVIRRQGEVLLSIVATARAEAAERPPASLPRPASAEARRVAKQLSGALQALADQLDVSAEILMPNRELELIAREALGETILAPATWHGWRSAEVIAPLRRRAEVTVENLDDAG